MMNNMYNPMMMNMNNQMMMNNMNNQMMMNNLNNANNPMMMNNMNNPMMMNNMNNPMMMNNMYMNNPMMMNMNNMMMNMNMNNPMMMMNLMNFSNNNLQNNENNSTVKRKSNTALGRLPREKITEQFNPNIGNNYSVKYNLIFSTPAGHRVIITTPIDIKIYDLLCLYMERVSLGPNLIGKGIYFLYDGRKLKEKDYNKLVKDFFQDRASLIVLDAGNLIGAKNVN